MSFKNPDKLKKKKDKKPLAPGTTANTKKVADKTPKK